MRNALNILFLAAVMLLLQCSNDVIVADGGSATETVGFTGTVTSSEGETVAGAKVLLRPVGFLAELPDSVSGISTPMDTLTVANTVTNSDGNFSFETVDTGTYNVEFRGESQGLLTRIYLGGSRGDVDASVTLGPVGSISGTITMPGDSTEKIYVQIYGLDRVEEVNRATGEFEFSDLPPGEFDLRVVTPMEALEPVEFSRAASEAGQDVDIGALHVNDNYSLWTDTLVLDLNTSSTGADIAGNVLNFPLLVRLTADQLNFSKTDGSDIRFFKTDGTPLPYEIERWDPAANRGEVWVLVDTVFGQSNLQSLYMVWGNPLATDNQSAHSVFDLNNGFSGVWHLGQSAEDTTARGIYTNSASDDSHGDDFITATGTSGIIGRGNQFAAGDYINLGTSNRHKPGFNVTLSGWVKYDLDNTHLGIIISTGGFDIRLSSQHTVQMAITEPNNIWSTATTDSMVLVDENWHHFTGTYDGSFIQVYVDGIGLKSTPHSQPISYGGRAPEVFIGAHNLLEPQFWMKGHLDEVRLSTVARSSAWIKLSFESQKENAGLVTFR